MFNIFTKNTVFSHKKQEVSDEYERGSAIIWIFLAVAIFAALNYAVSKGTRSGANQITNEQARAAATEILDYGRALRDAVRTLQINGCSDTDISFENGIVTGYEHTPAARDECKIFHPDGGGMNYIIPDDNWLQSGLSPAIQSLPIFRSWHTTSRGWLAGIGTDGSGSVCLGGATDGSCRELITGLVYLKREVCLEINNKLGFGTSDASNIFYIDSGSSLGGGVYTPFNGAYGNGYNLGTAAPSNYSNVMSGCIQSDTAPVGSFSFFQVLIAR